MKKGFIFTILFGLLFIATIPAQTTKTFTSGGDDSYWNNADNWIPAGVPGSTDNVLIPQGATVDVNADVYVNNLENNGAMNNVSYIRTNENIVNNGSMVASEEAVNGLHISVTNLTNNGSIGAVGPEGTITICAEMRADNYGTIMALNKITIETNIFYNRSLLGSSGGIKLEAKGWINNEGDIKSENGTGGETGYNNIYITCMNNLGDAMFYNTGHVTGGNGGTNYSVGDIFINTDDFRNRGYIQSGDPGDAQNPEGGSITINSNNFDNAGVIEALKNGLAHADFLSHDPSYDDSPPDQPKLNIDQRNILSNFFKIEAEEVYMFAKSLTFKYLGEYNSGTTIIGNNLVDIQSTNDADAVIDFSDNDSAATIISNGSISITGNNIIEPQVGLAFMCNIAPQITAGGVEFEGAAISSLGAGNSSGEGGQLEVLVKNQSSSAKDITVTLNSVLGWCDQNFSSTDSFEPWEVKVFNVDYLIPAGLNENTIDVVTINAQVSDETTISKEVSIYGSSSTVVSVEDGSNALPADFCLYQNYPNPFNPGTTIGYYIPARSYVELKVYDLLGREVKTLVDEEKSAGKYEIQFDGSGLTSGVYFYTLKSGSFQQEKKFVLLK